VNYALQFVGNPYKYGGSSLTSGADCSGFIMAVYKKFGVSLPHSSSALRSVGRGVSYSEAKPGDIICYSGHVALYMGGGKIVHASNPKDGIKISYNAQYKTILAVRRIF
jgi:cell wall-associated NlpC family hydrolase